MAPLSLSVALCTYNGSRFLSEQLQSIGSQSRPPDELIICDDRSSDSTVAIIKSFALEAPFPVRLEINPTNLGSTKNFELAISRCRGDVIALSDQDDIWQKDKLAKLERVLYLSRSVGAVFSDADVVDEQRAPLGYKLWDRYGFTRTRRRHLVAGRAFQVLLDQNAVTGATLAFRSWLKDWVIPIPPCWIHDAWIAAVTAAISDISIVEEPLIQYRQHAQNQVGGRKPRLPEFLKAAVRDNTAFYQDYLNQLKLLRQRLTGCSKLKRSDDLFSFGLKDSPFRGQGSNAGTKTKAIALGSQGTLDIALLPTFQWKHQFRKGPFPFAQMSRQPILDIIIVNWNTGTLLRDCLKSITQARGERFRLGRVIVVDNHSVDGSAHGLEDSSDPPISVLYNDTNRGFGAACNQGAAGTQADYLLFLNPDTRVFPDSLCRPLGFLEQTENGKIGICGVRHVNDAGAFSTSCARFPTLKIFFGQMTGLSWILPQWFPPHSMPESECLESRDVDQIIGAFFMVRRTLFEALSGFDPRFFVYFEEVDFSLRARHAGFRSYYLAGTTVYHKGGGSSQQAKAARLFYSLRSRLLYGFKHYSFLDAFTLAVLTLTIEMVARLLAALSSLSLSKFFETVQGYSALLVCLCTKRLRWRS